MRENSRKEAASRLYCGERKVASAEARASISVSVRFSSIFLSLLEIKKKLLRSNFCNYLSSRNKVRGERLGLRCNSQGVYIHPRKPTAATASYSIINSIVISIRSALEVLNGRLAARSTSEPAVVAAG